MKTYLPLILLPLLFLAGCGETLTEVAARHQPALDDLRGELKKLGELVAANPPEKALATPLETPMVFKADDTAASNTVLLLWDRLAEPEKTIDSEGLIDLYYSNGLENLFTWSTWEEKAFENYEQDLQRAFALRYLVAYRLLEHRVPSVDANLQYTIGAAVMGIHVYDREKKEIVCSFPVSALSDETVNYSYKQDGSDQVSAANSWARSSLWENLRKAVLQALAEKTGGTFAD